MTYTPGDILLVRDYTGGSDLIGNLILAGQRARYGDVDEARWTHSALIVSQTGELVEAMARGVVHGHISEYAKRETLIISPPSASPLSRSRAVEGALSQVGDRYGVLDFISLAFSLLSGLRWSLHADRQPICSELVSRYTEKYIASYPYCAERMMPADLGFYYKAFSGDPLPPLSFLGRALDKFRAVCWALSPFTKGIRPAKGIRGART